MTGVVHGERLLAQRSLAWKLATSSWVLLVAAGFVMFSVLGWALGAALSRSRKMWLWTLLWGVLYAAAAVAMELEGAAEDLGVLFFILVWVTSIAHAAYLARGVLRTRAVALAGDRGWEPAAAPTAPPSMPTIPLPDGVPQLRDDLRDSGPLRPPPGAPDQ